MHEHEREEYLRIAYRAADQDWRAINEAAHRPSPDDLAAARDRAQEAALGGTCRGGPGR